MRYGNHVALDALDLEVALGDVVGILGPNGAGKTSLLRLLATGRRPTSGSLRLLGRDASRPDAQLRRQIGIAGDEAVHADALTGRENVELFAKLAGLDAVSARRRAGELLEEFALGRDADRPVAHYSFGMRRKLLLVQALVHQPRLIVLDEPTTGLDQQGRDTLHRALRRRAADGAAAVLASNDPVEPQRLCDRVIFLHRGRVVIEGHPDELIERCGLGPRTEVRQPDLADVFLVATGEAMVVDARVAFGESPPP